MVRVILGDLLQTNFVIDPDVTGTVTLSTDRPLARDALLPVLESILETRGAKLVNYGNVYRITRSTEVASLAPGGISVAPAGLGRSGMIAAKLLTACGAEPAEAIGLVRRARPGAIETPAQEAYVLREPPLA